MKKILAFLLVSILFVSIVFINIYAEEITDNEYVYTEQRNINCLCTCGGSYGEWSSFATEVCQVRYQRQCSNCSKVQTAKDITPKTVPFSVPAIGANAGDSIMLSLYDVYFDDSTLVTADEITWSSTDIEIVDNQICPSVAGTYKLTAIAGSKTKTVYVVAKKSTDTEYALFFDDFDGEDLSEDYRSIETPNGTEYCVSDGKLILNALGNDTNQMRILLPEWIGDFGDYKIDTSFTFLSTYKNSGKYWFAVMARVQNENIPFWQAAVRQNATLTNGVEIAYKNKDNGWEVNQKGKFSEKISASTHYLLSFDILGANATHSIDGNTLLTTSKMTHSVGDVGFHLRASKVSIDSIRIVIPMDDSIHSFGNWEVVKEASCINDGIESRACVNCGKSEERTTKGTHSIVTHTLKAPTCTESGWMAYETCANCDYSTCTGVIPALGHYYDREIRSVAHRGYSTIAPEDTIPAYRLAKEMGFTYVECDVAFTADGVAVLLHDETIDRTSNGSGKISELTYEEVLKYDFGSWKSAEYAGTKILSFEDFIALCKELEVHPYIELKNTATYTQDNVNALVNVVKEYGMSNNCTWISFKSTYLEYVKNADDTARLGFVQSAKITQSLINKAIALRTEKNEVFLDIHYSFLTEDNVLLAALNGVAVETWTVNSAATLKKLPAYISGITSDELVANNIFTKSTITSPTCNEQGYTTYTCKCGESYIDNYVPATNEHTYENDVCTKCGAPVYCANPLHNLEIINISYKDGFDKTGIKTVKCLDCNAKETETQAPALFMCKGYSAPEDGRIGIALGFKADKVAISEYEKATGIAIRYGAFAVAQIKIGKNEIFDKDGNLFNGASFADITECNFVEFDIKIVGFADSQKNLLFAMGVYVKVTEGNKSSYSYLQFKAPNANEKYHFISYNEIANNSEVEK